MLPLQMLRKVSVTPFIHLPFRPVNSPKSCGCELWKCLLVLFLFVVLFLTGLLFVILLILKTCILFDCTWSSCTDNFPIFGLYTVVMVCAIIYDVLQGGKENKAEMLRQDNRNLRIRIET